MAWGYRIFPMNSERLAVAAEYSDTCSSARCPSAPTWVAAYTYATGHAGRAREAQRHVCTVHAQKFARDHGLAMSA